MKPNLSKVIKMIFIGILIGIGCAALGYFIYTHWPTSSRLNQQFEKEQRQIMATLTKKKDDYDQQLKKEFDAAAQHNQQKISQLIEEEKDIQKRFNEIKKELENDFKNKQLWYTQQEQQAALARSEANAKEIAQAAQHKSESLRKLEEDYKSQQEILKTTFEKYSEELKERKEQLDKEIQAYENKQNAIIEQFKKDEETKQKQDFYKVKLNDVEKKDVAQLKRLTLEFSKPEALKKVIYEVYYKARLEELFKRVLGENKDKGGIYKITNINNQKVYIGKTTKFMERWRVHSKRGCGLDTIKNILYDNMYQDGLENYTWEIVEVCSKEQQTEREKYWINFYKSNDYGYNQRVG